MDNLPEFKASLTAWQKRVDSAVAYASGIAGNQVLRTAKKNASNGSNPPTRTARGLRYHPHIPGAGLGPNVGTGNLRHNITLSMKKGFEGGYTIIVGSYAEYARAVEFGSKNWKSGVKYPYMNPARHELVASGALSRTFTNAFKTAMR